jgi:hypothetical protein
MVSRYGSKKALKGVLRDVYERGEARIWSIF